jgi:hypothetical protein
MGRGSTGGRSMLDLFVEQWPMLIFVPTVLGLVAAMVAVTGWWDRRDRARLAEQMAEKRARRAAALRASSSSTVVVPPPRRSGSVSRTGWRRRTRCNCSWHTVGTEGGTSARPLVAADPRGVG